MLNVGGGASRHIEDLSTALVILRRAFLDQAIIDLAASQIQDEGILSILSAKVDSVSAHLEWVSSQASDAGTWC